MNTVDDGARSAITVLALLVGVLLAAVGILTYKATHQPEIVRCVRTEELIVETPDGDNSVRIFAWEPGARIIMENAAGRHYEIDLGNNDKEPTIRTWSYGENE